MEGSVGYSDHFGGCAVEGTVGYSDHFGGCAVERASVGVLKSKFLKSSNPTVLQVGKLKCPQFC